MSVENKPGHDTEPSRTSPVVHLMRHGEVENPDGVLDGRLPPATTSPSSGRRMRLTRVAEHLAPTGGRARSQNGHRETFHMSAASRAPQRSNRAAQSPYRAARAVRARRRAALAAGAAAAALLLTACGSGGTSGGGGDTGFVTGTDGISTVPAGKRVAAPDLSGETLEGEQLDVGDFKGKVVVLNVWGSWCNPCRAEAKYFAKVSQEYAGKDVQFVGINTATAAPPPRSPSRRTSASPTRACTTPRAS
ncbi:Thiol-disulfide oxidoreductase ResA [Streptomyces griseoloalbus]